MKVTFTFVRQQQVAVAAPSGDRAERESSLFLPPGCRCRRRPSDRQLESKLGNDGRRRATAGYDDQIGRERGEGEGGDGERERERQAGSHSTETLSTKTEQSPKYRGHRRGGRRRKEGRTMGWGG